MYTLLIADDEQLERQALRFIIEKNYPQVQIVGEAGDGASAVRLAMEERPDIVLMDIRMPEINGLEAAKSIRVLLPDTRIVMLTAFDEFSYAKQALSMGAVEYLLKPVRPEELTETLRKVAEGVKAMKNKHQEEEALRKSVTVAMPFIQMSFVYDLISGQVEEMAHYRERAKFLGLAVDPGVALVIDIDNFRKLTLQASELEKQGMKQRLHQSICRAVRARSGVGKAALVAPTGSDNIVVLLGLENAETADSAKAGALREAESIRSVVGEELGLSITIGVGRYYGDPRDIYRSYHEAMSALRQRFYLGSSQVIHIEDAPHLSEGPFHYPFHAERAVLDKVRCGDRKQAKETLKSLLSEIFAKKSRLETVKACVLELLVVLSRSAVEGGASLDKLTLLNFQCIQRLNECHEQSDIERWMMEALDQFLDNMLENRNSMNLRVMNKACEYIVANCHRNLPLEEVAQTVHLSPFYFSRLFKKEKGFNFADFITRVRLDRAKKLLLDPDYTVVRIATEVGYQDASYFCRVFRQAMGMTPNQYRQELRGEKTKV